MRNPDSDKKFLNFPLCLLAQTITDPRQGMNAISNTSISTFARHCRRAWQASLVQAAYVATRRRTSSEHVSAAVGAILARPDVSDWVESIEDSFFGGNEGGFETRAIESLDATSRINCTESVFGIPD